MHISLTSTNYCNLPPIARVQTLHRFNLQTLDYIFRRIVTFLIIAPYKYIYLLTYLLTYCGHSRLTL